MIAKYVLLALFITWKNLLLALHLSVKPCPA